MARDKRLEELAKSQREADLRAVLQTPAGRRLYWRLVNEVSCAFGPSFAGDAHATAYNEGRRAVGLAMVLEAQTLQPDEYVAMLAEAVQDQRKAKERREAASRTDST